MLVLGPDIVHSKGGGGRSMHVLSPAQPDLIIDTGAAGATLTVISGAAVMTYIDNAYQPQANWVHLAPGVVQPMAPDSRWAFSQASRDPAVVRFAFT
jgi:hypothetical protein